MMSFLSDWRILDLSLLLPGPFATMRLAQLGAEVIKVEPPGGDPARELGTSPESRTENGGNAGAHFYRLLNAAKRVVEVDLKTDGGRAWLLAQVTRSDALIEGFRPGTLARLGLAPQELWAHNPRLVIVSITGYASDGPLAPYAGHDLDYLAWAGMIADGAWPGTLQVADLMAGAMHAALLTVAAVQHARATGQGAAIEVPMMETIATCAPWSVAEAMASANAAHITSLTMPSPCEKELKATHVTKSFDRAMFSPAQPDIEPERTPALASLLPHAVQSGIEPVQAQATGWSLPAFGLLAGAVPCYATYRCADGRWLAVAALEPKFWQRFCTALERAEWLARQFDTSGATHAEVQAHLLQRTQAQWCELLIPADCCVAPALGLREAQVRLGLDPSAVPWRVRAPA